jgi:hypothetical protein
MRKAALALLIIVCACQPRKAGPPSSSLPAPTFDAAFWSTWGDGQAELAGYELTYPRYGQLRRGTAVTIFVTEPFSNSARVKADPGRHPKPDEFPVMKLNVVKDFQTGIYDYNLYNLMLSTFIALQPVNGHNAGFPTKTSFSSQEWCGQVYEQLLYDPSAIDSVSHSYFDGEADRTQRLDYPADGVSADSVLLWARGMASPVLRPGEQRKLPLLRSLETVRLLHQPLAWSEATLSRGLKPETVRVASGEFQGEMWQVNGENGFVLQIWAEQAAPHRILRWQSSSGEKAELTGSARMKYWTLHSEGDEGLLKQLGLMPRPRRST